MHNAATQQSILKEEVQTVFAFISSKSMFTFALNNFVFDLASPVRSAFFCPVTGWKLVIERGDSMTDTWNLDYSPTVVYVHVYQTWTWSDAWGTCNQNFLEGHSAACKEYKNCFWKTVLGNIWKNWDTTEYVNDMAPKIFEQLWRFDLSHTLTRPRSNKNFHSATNCNK